MKSRFMLSMFVSIFGQNQEVAYILYNDQPHKPAPGLRNSENTKGHTKGEDYTVNFTKVYISTATHSR